MLYPLLLNPSRASLASVLVALSALAPIAPVAQGESPAPAPTTAQPADPAANDRASVDREYEAIVAGIDPDASLTRAASVIFLAIERRARAEGPQSRVRMLGVLAASGTERAFVTLAKYASAPRPELRADAMMGLARASSDAAMPMLEAGLADEHPDVRWCAIQAVGSMRRKAAVGLLIDRLRLEPEVDLRTSAHGLLVKMTGISIGPSWRDWTPWWEAAEGGFRFPDPDVKSRTAVGSSSAGTTPRFFGIEVGSRRVAFLVDISSSMLEVVPVWSPPPPDPTSGSEEKATKGAPRKGATSVGGGSSAKGRGDGAGTGVGKSGSGATGHARKIDILKRELIGVLRALPSATLVHIVTFSRDSASWQPELRSLEGAGRDLAIRFVEGLENGVGTNIFDTLEFALQDRRVDTVYLLTDGIPTAGKLQETGAILAEIRNRNEVRRVTIHTVAFGADSELLKSLAAQSRGTYRFVDRY